MPFPAWNSKVRLLAAVVLAGLLLLSSDAQDSQPSPQPAKPGAVQAASPDSSVLKDYSKPYPPYPNLLAPYEAHHVDPPNLANAPRLESLIKDGKLRLSLDDAIALTLENNLDLAIARYNLNIAETDILRTEGGASTLGVNAGIVQNTPGGSVGGLGGTVGSGTGGTSPGSAGVATGTNGLVSSTLGIGSTILSFDPILSGTLQIERAHSPSTNGLNGTSRLNTNTGIADFNYTQGLLWGTDVSVTFNNSHVTTNSSSTVYSPAISASSLFKLTQPVLQGSGKLPNTRFIRIATNNREITDTAFRLQIITTVDQIENLYWNLVYAYENVKVQQDALSYAQTILKDTRKQVEYGTTQPIQIVNAESTVAQNQQALILAQTNLQLQQLLMKNALSRTLESPAIDAAEVVPTSIMQMPAKEPSVSTTDQVNVALARRAELAESRIDLATRDLNIQAVSNALLPIVDPSIYYGGSGLGGAVNPKVPLCSATVTTRCFNPATAPSAFRNGGPVSYGNAVGQMFDSTAPDYGVATTFNITLRNREAQANQIRSELEYRQAQMRFQQLENQVRIEVRNAEFDVQQNRASVEAAQNAVDLASKSLYAEQRKLDVGVSDPDNVMQQQSALTAARSNLVSALAGYEKAQVELDRATGLLLDHAGIILSDAQSGQVTHMPTVPYIAPQPDNPAVTSPQTPATHP
ncbi:MAG: TolC family protein [Terriglobales bacterium]